MITNARIAVVTLGAQGIGRRTAELLAERGYSFAMIDIQLSADSVKAIEAKGGAAWGCAGDITNKSSVTPKHSCASMQPRLCQRSLLPVWPSLLKKRCNTLAKIRRLPRKRIRFQSLGNCRIEPRPIVRLHESLGRLQ